MIIFKWEEFKNYEWLKFRALREVSDYKLTVTIIDSSISANYQKLIT